jgi:MFS family permease
MNLRRIKTLFYTYAFFNAFILIYPLYAVMFADQGLNPVQISTLFIIWSLTAFLLEVPSGAIADKYPRKYILIIAVLFHAATFTSWLLMPTFEGILIGFLFWGINSALTSGTQEALIYDELKRDGHEKQYAKVTGSVEALDILGIVVAGAVASLLASGGYAPILVLSIAAVLISALAICLLPRAKPIETTEETKYWQYLKDGVKLAVKNRKILLLVIFLSVVTGFASVDEYFNLLFHEQGMSNEMIALWMGGVFAFGGIASFFAHKLEDKRFSIGLSLVVWGIFLYAATILPASVAPVGIGLYVALYYVVKILFNTRLQHELSDKNRATATSVVGFLSEAGAIISFIIFAIAAEKVSYALAFQIIAVIIVCIGIAYGLRNTYKRN